MTDHPENILRAWTALEVLSPASFKRKSELEVPNLRKVVPLDGKTLPWDGGATAIPGKKVVFEVFLGTMGMENAFEQLLHVYADKRPDKTSKAGRAILASVLVDKHGRPLEEEEAIGISSFAWGVPVALRGDLTRLGNWPVAARDLKLKLQRRLIRRDKHGEVLPLDMDAIQDAYEFLVSDLGLEGQDLAKPDFALRRYEYFAAKQAPELSILNSFFLSDLERARSMFAAGSAPEMLKRYLGVTEPAYRLDLLNDHDALREVLRAANTPLGRWPARGRHPLVLLQQAAVNGTVRELKNGGILAVNGPPGTGKTTLLRDIVVARIVERAEAMARFADPATAFSASGQSVKRDGAMLDLHRVDPALRGFEMVVASSNNKAVENVSAELPALAAIADDAPSLRYFKSISDNVLKRETWGMIAAVLGNSSNRYSFAEAFWRDAENGLATYLKHAVGTPQFAIEKDVDGNITRRPRRVVVAEAPPANLSEGRRRWKAACAAFTAAIEASRAANAERDAVHVALVSLPKLEADLRELQSRQEAAKRALTAFNHHELQRPGFFARLFGLRSAREWAAQRQDRRRDLARSIAALGNAKVTASGLNQGAAEAIRWITETESRIKELQGLIRQRRITLNAAYAREGMTIPDGSFFAQPHEEQQMATLWFDREAQHTRDRVFEAATALHRAFIDAAADPIRQNLAVFTESFGTRSFGNTAKDQLIEDLWATFFLVVPVVSTTFASVERMFAHVGPGALGWLLIDEAGQALPQAAVGGLLRSKRAVIVGDPLQIEPVVVLPNTLTEEICGQFGISPLKYNAPAASAQTIADSASPYCARFNAGCGYRDVGTPLLVHRRCDSPMFEISNQIAYANLMVQAKPKPHCPPVLGSSCWIDIRGHSDQDKWSEAEGREVLNLLAQLRASGAEPDIYIVTPFVVVQNTLRIRIKESGILAGWATAPEKWANAHVGTVHTVQGREAAIVIFVLGAPESTQRGARAWAGGSPNLLNVAVTRAKSAAYIVGNRQLWSEAGVFGELDRLIG